MIDDFDEDPPPWEDPDPALDLFRDTVNETVRRLTNMARSNLRLSLKVIDERLEQIQTGLGDSVVAVAQKLQESLDEFVRQSNEIVDQHRQVLGQVQGLMEALLAIVQDHEARLLALEQTLILMGLGQLGAGVCTEPK